MNRLHDLILYHFWVVVDDGDIEIIMVCLRSDYYRRIIPVAEAELLATIDGRGSEPVMDEWDQETDEIQNPLNFLNDKNGI